MNFKISLATLCFVWLVASPAQPQECRCLICENPLSQRSPERERYWQKLRQRVHSQPGRVGPQSLLGNPLQTVFLDFDSGDNGDIDYTPERRDQIVAELENIFQDFSVAFTHEMPTGEFSTIVFNEGGPGSGLAEDIDFRNLNKSDNGVLNVDGIGLMEDQIVVTSANIAAHELGHLMGLRHAEIFGPVGNGVLAGFGPFYTPDYLGPQDAFEAFDHIMATGAFGAPLSTFVTQSWLSEKSGVKLTYAERGIAVDDMEENDSIETAQPLEYQSLVVPNTIVKGQNAGVGDFSISSAVVVGTLDGLVDGQDIFEIEGKAGDLLNMEVLSNVPDRLAVDPIDPNISVFDGNGNFVSYFGVDAFNESELETIDSVIIDLSLPEDGSYFVQVDSSNPNDSGNYELFIFRFNGIIGDVNCDGTVDFLDIDPFVDLLLQGTFNAKADIDEDGAVDFLDIQPFVALINE